MMRPLDVEGLPTGIYSVDPNAIFQPGMIGGLQAIGGEIFMTVCDGTTVPPYGIFDDVKTHAFTKPVYHERIVLTPDPSFISVNGAGNPYINRPLDKALRTGNIIPYSFRVDVDVVLNPINGIVTFPANTPLNYSLTGEVPLDSILAVASYTFEIAGISGDDTTRGSGKVTVWNRRGEYITDQFDTLATYPLNAPLYACGGKLTTKAPCETAPMVGFVTGPPSTINATLQFLWW